MKRAIISNSHQLTYECIYINIHVYILIFKKPPIQDIFLHIPQLPRFVASSPHAFFMLAWPLMFPAWGRRRRFTPPPKVATPDGPRLIRQGMPRIPESTPTRNHATISMPQLKARTRLKAGKLWIFLHLDSG